LNTHYRTVLLVCCLISIGNPALGQWQPDSMSVASLPGEYNPHWVWVDDMSFFHMIDGRAYLVDADSGQVLGMLSPGGSFNKLELPADTPEIYAAATFYPRGTRGERTDAITIFDRSNLSAIGEVIIPAKRHTSIATLAHSTLTDDGRFIGVYNMTPAQSVSVVNIQQREFIEEISTPGCAMVYAAGERQFNMLCGDGSLLTVTIDDSGKEVDKVRSSPFFDPQVDPVTEKAVRVGDQWLYVSFDGIAYPVTVADGKPEFGANWSLLSDAERGQSWRIGGVQHLAAHQQRGLLYSLVHQGGVDTHKDPGTEVWVYDIDAKARVQRIELANLATSIQVSQDDEPLLLTAFIAVPALDVYDAASGEHLRTVGELGETIGLIQTH
jgi:methylamine dehydrogenase heavy chain